MDVQVIILPPVFLLRFSKCLVQVFNAGAGRAGAKASPAMYCSSALPIMPATKSALAPTNGRFRRRKVLRGRSICRLLCRGYGKIYSLAIPTQGWVKDPRQAPGQRTSELTANCV